MAGQQTSMFSDRVQACLKPPGGGNEAALELVQNGFRCPDTGKEYPFIEGIPSLYSPSKGEGEGITKRVRSFYEENPFPSYDGLEEFSELVNKGRQNSFSANLLMAVGFNNLILECGCGTGQLSHFLQLNNNHVLGIDMSLSSLRLAVEHKLRNGLERSNFAQMNIFDLAVKDESFDVVISQGVLHHTFNARRAFAHIVRKVKPGGIVLVGLYNYYARVPTWLRSKVIGLLVDYIVRHRTHDERKADIWSKDQYDNPHETWHSLDEVLYWFVENGVEYLNAYPPILGTNGEEANGLFEKTYPGNSYQRVVTQLSWLATTAREGALFEVIGRKKS